MTMHEPPTRRRASRRRRYLIALVGLVVVFFAVFYGFFWLTNPWAVSLPGKPALTGYWHGELSVAPGDNRRVFIELRADPPGSKCRGGCPKIKGTGKVCGAGQNTTYEIWGSPLNYSGTRFSLHTRSTTEGPGSYLSGLDGAWDEGRAGGLARAASHLSNGQDRAAYRLLVGYEHAGFQHSAPLGSGGEDGNARMLPPLPDGVVRYSRSTVSSWITWGVDVDLFAEQLVLLGELGDGRSASTARECLTSPRCPTA